MFPSIIIEVKDTVQCHDITTEPKKSMKRRTGVIDITVCAREDNVEGKCNKSKSEAQADSWRVTTNSMWMKWERYCKEKIISYKEKVLYKYDVFAISLFRALVQVTSVYNMHKNVVKVRMEILSQPSYMNGKGVQYLYIYMQN